MSDTQGKSPLTQKQLLDLLFMEHRNDLIEIAAFLDRLDRAAERDAESDFRLNAFRTALQTLLDAKPDRVTRVQIQLSDPRTELLEERDKQQADGASPHTGEAK